MINLESTTTVQLLSTLGVQQAAIFASLITCVIVVRPKLVSILKNIVKHRLYLCITALVCSSLVKMGKNFGELPYASQFTTENYNEHRRTPSVQNVCKLLEKKILQAHTVHSKRTLARVFPSCPSTTDKKWYEHIFLPNPFFPKQPNYDFQRAPTKFDLSDCFLKFKNSEFLHSSLNRYFYTLVLRAAYLITDYVPNWVHKETVWDMNWKPK